MANATVEYQPARRWGLAAKAHYGTLDWREDDDEGTWDLFAGRQRLLGVGGEARFYPYRNGFHVASGVAWWRVRSTREDLLDETSHAWMANGVAGWKGVARSGLTLDLQAGASLPLLEDGEGTGDEWLPLLRVNLGWSF